MHVEQRAVGVRIGGHAEETAGCRSAWTRWRRAQGARHGLLPGEEEIGELIKLKLHKFLGNFSLKTAIDAANGLSHAEITNACNDALKEIILTDKNVVTQKLLVQMMKDRRTNHLI